MIVRLKHIDQKSDIIPVFTIAKTQEFFCKLFSILNRESVNYTQATKKETVIPKIPSLIVLINFTIASNINKKSKRK